MSTLKPLTWSCTHAWASKTSAKPGLPTQVFSPAKPPAHWLMVAEVDGTVLKVPLAPARNGNPKRCRYIGCYEASRHLADQYRRDK